MTGYPRGVRNAGFHFAESYCSLTRRAGRRSISTTKDEMGIPLPPSAQPTDEAKQMLDPTLNLG